jgi:hypothetical protein
VCASPPACRLCVATGAASAVPAVAASAAWARHQPPHSSRASPHCASLWLVLPVAQCHLVWRRGVRADRARRRLVWRRGVRADRARRRDIRVVPTRMVWHRRGVRTCSVRRRCAHRFGSCAGVLASASRRGRRWRRRRFCRRRSFLCGRLVGGRLVSVLARANTPVGGKPVLFFLPLRAITGAAAGVSVPRFPLRCLHWAAGARAPASNAPYGHRGS